MRKVAPSAMVREQIEQTLYAGVDTETNLLSTLAQLGLEHIVQQALEQEQEDFLGRGRYERQQKESAHKRRSYRNGYGDGTLATADGEVSVRMPQVRGEGAPYHSKLMSSFRATPRHLSVWSSRCTLADSPPVTLKSASGTRARASL